MRRMRSLLTLAFLVLLGSLGIVFWNIGSIQPLLVLLLAVFLSALLMLLSFLYLRCRACAYNTRLKRRRHLALSWVFCSCLLLFLLLQYQTSKSLERVNIALVVHPDSSASRASIYELLSTELLKHPDLRICSGPTDFISSPHPASHSFADCPPDVYVLLTLPARLKDGTSEGSISLITPSSGSNHLACPVDSLTDARLVRLMTELFAELSVPLLPVHQTGLHNDPELNNLYLQARDLYLRRTRDNLYAACERFRQLIMQDSTFTLARAGLAETLAQLRLSHWERENGILEEAVAHARQAVRDRPFLPQAHKSLGVCLGVCAAVLPDSTNDWSAALSEAIASTHRAVELEPTYLAAHLNLISLYSMSGDFHKAHLSFARAIALDPSCPDAYLYDGYALMSESRYYEAIELFSRFVEQVPDRGIGLYNLACAYARVRKYDAAIRYLALSFNFTDYAFPLLATTDADLRELRLLFHSEFGDVVAQVYHGVR